MKILSMNAAAIGLAWCTLLVAPTVGSAQTSLSLAEAQDKALDQAYAMERALIDVEVAKRDVKELLATGLPQVTGSVDFNHFIDIPTQVVPASSFDPAATEDMVLEFSFGTTQSLTAGLNVTQLIFNGGKRGRPAKHMTATLVFNNEPDETGRRRLRIDSDEVSFTRTN